ncbi:hypothetical protein G6011_02910 [Alternaria panax]|uniref:Heterokaryon incompatibility domain-containing protein n=1 Tax=Alternaria panax TaxID=48097 RepID=A0AAD4F9J5_9PLEO|nr:hypothetical protein G6011_02910 [Alternaria panax]
MTLAISRSRGDIVHPDFNRGQRIYHSRPLHVHAFADERYVYGPGWNQGLFYRVHGAIGSRKIHFSRFSGTVFWGHERFHITVTFDEAKPGILVSKISDTWGQARPRRTLSVAGNGKEIPFASSSTDNVHEGQEVAFDTMRRTIRLLTVEPGDSEAPLHCNLSETCLDTTPTSYYALSYCWGANTSPIQITCNSHPLLVTPNLHSVLVEYRRRDTNTSLWVDAICINQSNIEERTSQVRMMDQIYSKAECVVVWLGEAEATDKMALELLKEIHVPWANCTDIPIMETGALALQYDAYFSARVPQAYWNALAAFLLRPWFSRVWIVQEFLLARRVTIWCGSSTVDEEFPFLETIARFSQMIICCQMVKAGVRAMAWKDDQARREAEAKWQCAHALFVIKFGREESMDGTLHLFMMTRWFDATDQRDRIFALVGLTNDMDKGFVDYSKSYEDMIKELNLMLLNGRIGSMGCVLDIWSYIHRGEEDDITEPSWMVDPLKAMDSAHTPMMTAYPNFNLPIERSPEIQFLEREGRTSIDIRGTVFDHVTHVIPFPFAIGHAAPQTHLELHQNISTYIDWLQRVGDIIAPLGDLTTPPVGTKTHSIYQPTGEFLYHAFWRTLCCNSLITDAFEPPADHEGYFAWLGLLHLHQWRRENPLKQWRLLGIAIAPFSALAYRFRRNKLMLCATLLALPLSIRLFNRTWNWCWDTIEAHGDLRRRDFESMHTQWAQGRQFGVTGLGMIGLLPSSAKVGDNVGLFAGCRVPYVLRRAEGGYKIVGDAYLHGAMNGEGEQTEGKLLRIL